MSKELEGRNLNEASIVMKFRAVEVAGGPQQGTEYLNFSAVIPQSEDDDSNRSWSQATPSGQLSAQVSNLDAMRKIKAGNEYYLILIPVKKANAEADKVEETEAMRRAFDAGKSAQGVIVSDRAPNPPKPPEPDVEGHRVTSGVSTTSADVVNAENIVSSGSKKR